MYFYQIGPQKDYLKIRALICLSYLSKKLGPVVYLYSLFHWGSYVLPHDVIALCRRRDLEKTCVRPRPLRLMIFV